MAHAHHGPAYLAHHFDTPEAAVRNAAKLGMWVFLAQEILFFSGLFVAYGIFRSFGTQKRGPSARASPRLEVRRALIRPCSSFRVGRRRWRFGRPRSASRRVFPRSNKLKLGGRRGGPATSSSESRSCARSASSWSSSTYEYSHKFHVGFLAGPVLGPCPYFDLTRRRLQTAESPCTKNYGSRSMRHGLFENGAPDAVPFHIAQLLRSSTT